MYVTRSGSGDPADRGGILIWRAVLGGWRCGRESRDSRPGKRAVVGNYSCRFDINSREDGVGRGVDRKVASDVEGLSSI